MESTRSRGCCCHFLVLHLRELARPIRLSRILWENDSTPERSRQSLGIEVLTTEVVWECCRGRRSPEFREQTDLALIFLRASYMRRITQAIPFLDFKSTGRAAL